MLEWVIFVAGVNVGFLAGCWWAGRHQSGPTIRGLGGGYYEISFSDEDVTEWVDDANAELLARARLTADLLDVERVLTADETREVDEWVGLR